MFELRPFERRNNHVAAYDPWDQMERAFFGDGSWGRGLSEFKTDIQDNTRIKHRCTLFVDKILYRRMHEDKMRSGLPALIRPRIV